MKYYTLKAKKWKANNPDKVCKSWIRYNKEPRNIERHQVYYLMNKNRISEQKKEHYLNNKILVQARHKNYYNKNKIIILKKSKRYYQYWKTYNKFQVVFHYTNGKMCCQHCGENVIELLTIDHINGGGNKHRKSLGQTNFYSWLKRNNYPIGFQILCYNCNCVKAKVTPKRYDEIIRELQQRELFSKIMNRGALPFQI